MIDPKLYRLIGRRSSPPFRARSAATGGRRVYGRLDCAGALRWIAKGHYVRQRVFFADEETAIAAGYRPCAGCMREEYRRWKAAQASPSM